MEETATYIWGVPILVSKTDLGTYMAESPFLNIRGDLFGTVWDAIVNLLEKNSTENEGSLFLDEDHYSGTLSPTEVADLLLAVGAKVTAPEPPIESHLPTLE